MVIPGFALLLDERQPIFKRRLRRTIGRKRTRAGDAGPGE